MLLEYILSGRYEVFAAVSIIVLLSIIVTLCKNSRRNFPPGPWGIPVFGYIPFLPKNPYLKIVKLSKKYGDVFSLRLGSELVVILNDTASIREAFGKQEFLGTSPNTSFAVFGGKKPFRLNNMRMWQEHRRFLINNLKHHAKLEEIMQDEIKRFLEVLKSSKSQPINFAALLTPSLSNNMSTFIFGKRYGYDEQERRILDENLEKISRIISKEDPLTYFPWIKHVPFLLKWLGFEINYKFYQASEGIFRKRMEEHTKTLDDKSIRDFIDCYLVELQQRQKKEGKTTLKQEALFGIVTVLFSAADDSTRSSIGWLFYTMAAFPDVQKRIQEEIGQVIGMDRNPEFQDMKSMPYTHAAMMEVMRCNTVAALNMPRYTLSDSTIAGYDIPAGTLVTANFWAVHNDPRNWEDPDSFKPERFLTPDGKNVVKSPHYMPFSIGKRSCPGETVAYMEIFLYLVAILREFDVRFPEGYEPTFVGSFSNSYKPPIFKIIFKPRN